jgi:hypothetical protein
MCVLEELGVPTPLSLKSVSLAEEVLKSPEGFVLAMEPVGLLQVLRRLRMWGRGVKLGWLRRRLDGPRAQGIY